jgi:hypothetical protein
MRNWILALVVCLSLLAIGCEPDGTEITGPAFFPSNLGPPKDSISASGTIRDPNGVAVQGVGVFLRFDSSPGTYARDTVFTDLQGQYSTGWIRVYSLPCSLYSLVFFHESSQLSSTLPNCGPHTINVTWTPSG